MWTCGWVTTCIVTSFSSRFPAVANGYMAKVLKWEQRFCFSKLCLRNSCKRDKIRYLYMPVDKGNMCMAFLTSLLVRMDWWGFFLTQSHTAAQKDIRCSWGVLPVANWYKRSTVSLWWEFCLHVTAIQYHNFAHKSWQLPANQN